MANVLLEHTKLYLWPPVGNCTESVMAAILIWFGWGWVKEWIVGICRSIKRFFFTILDFVGQLECPNHGAP